MDIYILKWTDRRFILASRDSSGFLKALDNAGLNIYYGSCLAEEDRVQLNQELRVHIERGVNRWISDSRFILHTLLAAGVFLVSFYFLSYVIRDPLPLVDEILGSGVLSVLAWFRLGNQQYQSEKALRKKLEMEQKSKAIVPEASLFVQDMEDYLEQLAVMDRAEQKKLLSSEGAPAFFSSQSVMLGRFYSLLAERVNWKFIRDFPELRLLARQIRKYLKYHSSML